MAPEKPTRLKIRARKLRFTWVNTRKLVQILALAAFVALFLYSRRGGWPPELVNIPMRLDPLLVLSNLLASKEFLAGSTLVFLTLLLTIAAGRAWCGWLCPLGTLLEWITPHRKKKQEPQPPPETWRNIKYGLLVVTLTAAIFGNLTLLFLDPLTILFRTLTTSILPPIDQLVTGIERSLSAIPFLEGPISSFDELVRPAILPGLPLYYRDALIYFLVFAGVIALNWKAPRFWCRYLCPLGALLGLISKVSIFRRVVGDDCRDCGVCSARCPTGTIDADRGYESDPSECTMCLECLENCPRSTVKVERGWKPAAWRSYDPSRRQALASIGAAIAGVALLQSDQRARRDSDFLIRPPGSRQNNLLSKCVRCGECMRACPTTALQPALLEDGIEGMMTPILIMRLGACDFSCNACGQVCPVQAIPPLNLEEKRITVIGKAYIDQNRCIAWADHFDCIVCEEMCPLPEKAIKLKETEVMVGDGTTTLVKLPTVFRDVCIGCGICEYKCPVNGESAIRVYTPENVKLYKNS